MELAAQKSLLAITNSLSIRPNPSLRAHLQPRTRCEPISTGLGTGSDQDSITEAGLAPCVYSTLGSEVFLISCTRGLSIPSQSTLPFRLEYTMSSKPQKVRFPPLDSLSLSIARSLRSRRFRPQHSSTELDERFLLLWGMDLNTVFTKFRSATTGGDLPLFTSTAHHFCKSLNSSRLIPKAPNTPRIPVSRTSTWP